MRLVLVRAFAQRFDLRVAVTGAAFASLDLAFAMDIDEGAMGFAGQSWVIHGSSGKKRSRIHGE